MRYGHCVLDEPPNNDGENTQLKREATQQHHRLVQSDENEEVKNP
ncbi:MAG: hypothetical protein Kow00117_06900 [Phototrophicales bacterium]